MTPQPLPDTPTLIERVKGAMRDAHAEWRGGRKRTAALKWQVWKLGFVLGVPDLYPMARLGKDAAGYAEKALAAREAHFWPHPEEHSPLKEWLYDVAWAEFDGEYHYYTDDRDTAWQVPNFKRLVLALESELADGPGGREWPMWHVLTDFHKLLAARAELRVLVWPRDKFSDGFALLEPRLRKADGWKQGWWLLSGWGKDGFEHRVYHDGERREDLERAPK